MIEWHLLGKREHAFRTITSMLNEHCVIVETGTIRTLGNWAGDGQSTIVWNWFAEQLNGQVWTIDLDETGAQLVDQLQLSKTIAITGDSLDMIPKLKLDRIDFLYLDSCDVDWSNPEPSAKHHLDELMEAFPMLGPGSIVAVDDNMAGSGKGMHVAQHMESIGATQIVDGYVIGWKV
jgi:predicted O-methyltransferase YrrM